MPTSMQCVTQRLRTLARRRILVLFTCACIIALHFTARKRTANEMEMRAQLRTYWPDQAIDFDVYGGARDYETHASDNYDKCRMETCFDYSRCSRDDFKVYVYPRENQYGDAFIGEKATTQTTSVAYQRILKVLQESRYITNDPTQACLFVLAIDTLDRDPLSVDYSRNVQSRIQKLSLWNNGLNHIIFNLYSGSWPGYVENNLGFNPALAILAKASVSATHLRHGFDISIPLFHQKHPEKGGEPGAVQSNKFPPNKRYLLAFKGKRYVHGIGSETRNALYHLHNDADVILVTTCRHGKSWRELKDERCDEDNLEYDRYTYDTLLNNATFCLVPRGRRLGSFRFLEAIKAGCIPVILSNDWTLPFSQVIDWNKAVVWADERLLLQVPDIVRSITAADVMMMRQQTQLLWERYFSSIEKIIFTTLEIVRDRLPNHRARDAFTWNVNPGALLSIPSFSDSIVDYPFYSTRDIPLGDKFTAVIYCQIGMPVTQSSSFYKLLKNVARSKNVARVVIVWLNEKSPLPQVKYLPTPATLPVFIVRADLAHTRISQRFYPHVLLNTPAILSLDEDSSLSTDEIDFAFTVWQSFPNRIVGFPARSHYWDDSKSSWGYTSKWTNDYSIVLTGAAFYHSYYNVLYTEWLSPLLHKTVEQSQNCEDILMNFLVSHVTKRPPIKVTQRKQYKEQRSFGLRSPWNDPDHFVQRQTCLNTFAAVFGYMPLLRSSVRLDPVLFKDDVSKKRKRYRQVELVNS